MSTLEFLAVDQDVRSDRFQPVKKSALQRRLAEAGAEFEVRDGWLVAVRVPAEDDVRIAIRDVTPIYRVEESEGEIEFGDGEHGVRPPTGVGRTVVARRREGAPPVADGVDDMSSAWCGLEIEGGGASRVMRRLTELDLDELPAIGLAAHIRVLMARPGDEHYLLFCPQEYGHYLWEVVVDAAEPLGGGPSA